MTSRIGKPNTDTDMALHERLAGDGNRHFVMVAGAGSGKTTSLVKALAQIERTQGPTMRRNGVSVRPRRSAGSAEVSIVSMKG